MRLPCVEVITRRDCCLCEQVKETVAKAAALGLCTWRERDVDSDREYKRRFGLDVPVVLINGEARFKHRVEPTELERVLRGAGAC